MLLLPPCYSSYLFPYLRDLPTFNFQTWCSFSATWSLFSSFLLLLKTFQVGNETIFGIWSNGVLHPKYWVNNCLVPGYVSGFAMVSYCPVNLNRDLPLTLSAVISGHSYSCCSYCSRCQMMEQRCVPPAPTEAGVFGVLVLSPAGAPVLRFLTLSSHVSSHFCHPTVAREWLKTFPGRGGRLGRKEISLSI